MQMILSDETVTARGKAQINDLIVDALARHSSGRAGS
jgi:hypothetical protein